MSLINWSGNDPLERLERRMNLVFEHIADPWKASRQHSSSGELTTTPDFLNPAVDVYETDKGWNIQVDLPGVRKENIKIDANDNSVTLTAENKVSSDYTRDNVRYQERRFGTYSRTIPLPESVNRDKIDAKFQDGVLSLFLPKGEASKPKKITVS